MAKKYLPYFVFALIVGCVCLWMWQWLGDRPLFIDEANVARNVFDRSFAGLFAPLDHRQYAPPGYLILVKACGQLFDYGEGSLRLPSLLGGAFCLVGLVAAAKSLRLGWLTLFPLSLLLLNETAIRYFVELKPYSLDLGISALLLAAALRWRRPTFGWVVAGSLAVWFSLPAVFVLAAIGASRLLSYQNAWSDKWRWCAIGAGWLISFGALYLMVLEPSVGEDVLTAFHRAYFFPARSSEGSYQLVASAILLFSLPAVAFGHTFLAAGAGATLVGYGLFRKYDEDAILLALPLLFVLIASGFELYSLIPRLILFTLPSWWLLAAWGTKSWWEETKMKDSLKYVPMGLALLSMTGMNLSAHLSRVTYSNSRAIVTEYDRNYSPTLHWSAEPAFDYYHRIHPAGDRMDLPQVSGGVTDGPKGKFVRLYCVTTTPGIRAEIRADVEAAEVAGCSVREVVFPYAHQSYIECK